MVQQYDDRGKDPMLDALAALVTRVALHTGDPGAADQADDEVAGGSYARQPITFSAASGGILDASDTPTIPVPGGTTVTWVSFWNTAGNQRFAKKELAAPEAFGADGTLTLIDGTQLDLLNDPV